MKISNLIGERFKENPRGVTFKSHALLIRGGYIKNVGNGIYSLFTPMKRITSKIEKIMREEMELAGGQEVMFPVTMPASIWEESGRYSSIGKEMLRFNDRSGAPMVLGMTHEEASVQLVREYANSYSRYPFMIYQIQTKFRDEARPRAGLIRVREFTMKDAYSFHTSQESLEEWYDKLLNSYNRIFARVGLPETVCVRGDSGMMGGSISHEYMLLTPMGEDSLAVCTECDYKSNVEAAECNIDVDTSDPIEELKKVYTPNVHTMDDLKQCINSPIEKGIKAVVYELESDCIVKCGDKQKQCSKGDLVVTFIRGDLEVNETKVSNYIGANILPATLNENSPIIPGFIGPIGLDKKDKIAAVIFDKSVDGMKSLTCGANERDYHFTGLNIPRDVGDVEYVDIAVIEEGMRCPVCNKHSIKISRGIEVGNIFQLGTKYSKPMHLDYIDESGKSNPAIMGCYGIGVGRLAASICEVRNDDFGPIWPITVAPWEVHLCLLRADDDKCLEFANDIYQKMQEKGIEVIYDDRKDIRPGEMFADADLLGCPIRVIVSPRNMKNGEVEIVTRDKTIRENVKLDNALEYISNLKDKLISDIEKGLDNF